MNITHRQSRLLEKACLVMQWGLLGMAGWLFVSLLFGRRDLPQPDLSTASVAQASTGVIADRVSLSDLEMIWRRDLRQRLIEPKAKPVAKPAPKPPPAPVKLPSLLATFVEEGRAWGLFVDAKGNQRVRTTRGTINGFEITEVRPGAASLAKNGQTYQVEVPRREKPMAKRRAGKRR